MNKQATASIDQKLETLFLVQKQILGAIQELQDDLTTHFKDRIERIKARERFSEKE